MDVKDYLTVIETGSAHIIQLFNPLSYVEKSDRGRLLAKPLPGFKRWGITHAN